MDKLCATYITYKQVSEDEYITVRETQCFDKDTTIRQIEVWVNTICRPEDKGKVDFTDLVISKLSN